MMNGVTMTKQNSNICRQCVRDTLNKPQMKAKKYAENKNPGPAPKFDNNVEKKPRDNSKPLVVSGLPMPLDPPRPPISGGIIGE